MQSTPSDANGYLWGGYIRGNARDNVLTYRCGGRLGHPGACTSAPLEPQLTFGLQAQAELRVAPWLSQTTANLAVSPPGRTEAGSLLPPRLQLSPFRNRLFNQVTLFLADDQARDPTICMGMSARGARPTTRSLASKTMSKLTEQECCDAAVAD